MVNISALFKTISIFFDYILVRKVLTNQEIHAGFENRWYGIYPRMTDDTNCRRVTTANKMMMMMMIIIIIIITIIIIIIINK